MASTNTETKLINTPMQITRIYVTNGNKTRQMSGVATIDIVDTGLWREDNVFGKNLCRIIVKVPGLGIQLAFVPSEGFEQELLTSWLDAERHNDSFVFKNPRFKKQRPEQLAKKIKFVATIVDNYKKAWQKG